MINFKSTIGPIVMNDRCAAGEKDTKDAATNASASEQIDNRIASTIIAPMDNCRLLL